MKLNVCGVTLLLAVGVGGCKSEEAPSAPDASAAAAPELLNPTTPAQASAEPLAPLASADPMPAAVSPEKSAASVAEATTDAGASSEQECCCEAPNFALQSVAMSECNKTRKGKCVAKNKCTSAPTPTPVPSAPAPAASSNAQTCCCSSEGKLAIKGMSECTKGGAGHCVKALQCK